MRNFGILFFLLLALAAPSLGEGLNDRVVGFWTSSSGAQITVSYSNDPSTFWIQVFSGNTQVAEYTGSWKTDRAFYYWNGKEQIEGYVESESLITLHDSKSWSARWTR